MDEMKLSSLLTDVKRLISEHEAKRAVKAGFNIFNITRIDTDEWKCCAILRELLDPNGTHGQGASFLRTFVSDVLQVNDVGSGDFDTAEVKQEQGTDAGRSIDLVIKLGSRRFPIEAKVNASDQERQLCDYHAYITKEDPAAKIYYLTPDGHQPSGSSRGDLVEHEQYERLSWTENVLPWLTAMVEKVSDVPRLRESLAQFAEVLEQMKKQDEGELNMAIQDLVTAENINAIDELAKAVKAKKTAKLREAFEAIKARLKPEEHGCRLLKADDKHLVCLLPREPGIGSGDFALCVELQSFLYVGVASWDVEANAVVAGAWNDEPRSRHIAEKYGDRGYKNWITGWHFAENLLDHTSWELPFAKLLDEAGFDECVAAACGYAEQLMDKWSQQ